MSRLKGLTDLLQDAVDRGTVAIQQVHSEIASRPFDLLQQVPPLDAPARAVRRIHDVVVARTYTSIRLVNQLVHVAADAAIDAVTARRREETER